MGVRASGDGDSTVIRRVQPFVGVGRPRVGPLDSAELLLQDWRSQTPQSDGPIDMEPDATIGPARLGFVEDVGELVEMVDPAGVDVTRLSANDQGTFDIADGFC